jgi:hypothetical protein
MGLLSTTPERYEWNFVRIVELGSAAKPTSEAAKADGSTRRAAPGTVATGHKET